MNNPATLFRIGLVLFAVAVSGCAAPRGVDIHGQSAGQSEGLDEWLEAAAIEMRQGDPIRAAFWLSRVLEQEPLLSAVRIDLARILLNASEWEAALQVLSSHAVEESKRAEAEEIIATVHLRQGRFEDARRHLERSLEQDPAHWPSWNALGVLLDLEGRASEAREGYRRALAYAPDSPKVLNNLGYSYFLSGELVTAERILRQGELRAPGDPRIAVNLGIVLAWQGRDQEAMSVVQRALGEAAARNNVGYVAMLNQRHSDARYWFETALSRHVRYYVRASQNLRRNSEESSIDSFP